MVPQKINKKRLGMFNKDDKNVRNSKDKRSVTLVREKELDEKTKKIQEEEVDSIFEQRSQRPPKDDI
jgi:hypothetical protein